jgi:dCMP deaminase
MSTKKWYDWFDKLADFVAAKSKDKSTKVGAIIIGDGNEVISMGYNGFPRGVNDDIPERHERPIKYKFTEHAERNAIYNAARKVLEGTTLVLNFDPCPCTDCTRAIIQSGIKRIVGYGNKKFPGKGEQWEEDLKISKIMLAEAGIDVVEIENIE